MNPQKSAPKKAEHILQKGEDFSAADWISVLNSIIRDSPFPMWIADKTGTVIQTNKALCAVLQLENEQISGKYNVLEDENLIKQGVMPQVKAVFKVHKIARFTIFWSGAALKKDAFAKAPDLWIDVTIFPILNKKGQLSHVACHWVDISERVEAERQLRLSEESNRAIIDNAGLGIGYYDLDGVILRMNQKACSLMEMAEDELLGRGTLEVYGPEMGALILKRINKAAASTHSESYEDNVPLPTGTRWFRSTYAPTIDTDGIATAVQIISEDITPLKDVEMAFRENRRALETLVGNLPGMAYRCDNDENWTMRYLSEGCFDLTGYQPQDLIQNKIISYNALIHEQDRPYVHQVVQAALNKNQSFELAYRIITAASEEKWVWEKGIGVFSETGEFLSLEGFISDITARVYAENTLKESLLLLETTQQIGKIGGWVWDAASSKMTWTDETYRIHDIEPKDIQPGLNDYVERSLSCYPPEDQEKISVLFYRCIEQGDPYYYECGFTTFKNRKLWIRTAGRAVHENGRISRVVGYIMDITERKQAQIKLEESEARFRAFMDHLPAAAYIKDAHLKHVYLNQAALESVGKSIDEYIGSRTGDFHDLQGAKLVEQKDRIVLKEGRSINFERELVFPNGKKIWQQETKFPLTGPNGEKWIGGIAIDLTEKRREEEILRESEQQFHSLFTAIQSGFVLLECIYGQKGKTIDFRFLQANPAFETLIGINAQKLIGSTILEIFPNFDPKWITNLAEVAQTGESVQLERFYPKFNKHFSQNAFCPHKGQVAVITVDITRNKLDQQVIQKRTEELERFNRLSVGRELKMVDLKKEINQLCRELGSEPRYRAPFGDQTD